MLFVDAKIPGLTITATIEANYGSTVRSQGVLGSITIAASTNKKTCLTFKYYYIDTHNLVHQG